MRGYMAARYWKFMPEKNGFPLKKGKNRKIVLSKPL
jgi:hypothetical protein